MKKRVLDDHISWYVQNIPVLEEQQNERKRRLAAFQKELYELELNYYANGV